MADVRSQIAALGPIPALIEEGIIELLRALFEDADGDGQADLVRDTMLKSYYWNSDHTKSRIVITSASMFDIKTASTAIVVSRDTASLIPIGNQDGFIFQADDSDVETHGFLSSCTFSIICRSPETAAHADRLACEVAFRFKEIQRQIEDDFKLKDFEVTAIGAPQRSSDRLWTVVVQVKTIGTHHYTINPTLLPSRLKSDFDM